MGVCSYGFGDAAVSRDTMLKHADRKLYEAKAAGRNQVVY